MKRICLQIILCLSLLSTGLAQNCIPDILTLSSQQAVDDFPSNYPTCTNIEGTLVITATDLTNLNGLDQIESIETELIFDNNTFTDLSILELPFLDEDGPGENKVTFRNNAFVNNLAGLGSFMNGPFDTVVIENYPGLTDMSGFDAGLFIEQNFTLRLSQNPQLSSLTGMENLISIGDLQLVANPMLTSLSGLENVSVFERLELIDNVLLSDLSAISQVLTFDKGLTISGSDALASLADLQNLIVIPDGYLVIDNNNALTDLSGLNNLLSVAGLVITNNQNLTTLIHLNDLEAIIEDLEISDNPLLENFEGMEDITMIQGEFTLENLPEISDFQGFSNLAFVGSNFKIRNISPDIIDLSDFGNLSTIGGNLEILNTGFVTLAGLENITALSGRLYIQQNDALVSLEALSNLTNLNDGLLAIRFQDELTSLDGLHNINPNTIDSLNLFSNDLLVTCSQANICSYLANDGGHFIMDNATAGDNCFDLDAIQAVCQIVDPILTGSIYVDENGNCANENEPALNDAIVQIEGGGNTFYSTTNTSGIYTLSLPVGTYSVSLINFDENLWDICNNATTVTLEDNQQIEQDLGLSALVDCPKLTVDVASGSLLPCQSTVIKINYCNNGTTEATEITVDIVFDEGYSFIGGSITPTLTGDTYTFEVPDLGFNECGTFDLTVIYDPSCNTFVTNQTACITATIKPDSFCLPPSALWDGSSLSAFGICDGDSIRYTIVNEGLDMTAISDYIIIEDNIMMLNGPVDNLNNGDSINIVLPAMGETYRIEVTQINNHPGFSRPSFTIEGCDPDGDDIYSLGFYRQYPQDDIDHFIDIECMDVLDIPYVNEKTADPLGVTEAHCLQRDVPIEYTFHFQNTGTQMVEQVIIKDILSPFLDISSIQPGSSSHEYDFEVTDMGTAQFTFSDINLPDSTSNVIDSRGFVSFKIGQKENTPFGSLIENEASLQFDTTLTEMIDMVFHTVEASYCIDTIWRTDTDVLINNSNLLKVYPNPFENFAILEWTDPVYPPNGEVSIYDLTGRLIKKRSISKRQTILKTEELSAGVYLYEVTTKEGWKIGQGKLIRH